MSKYTPSIIKPPIHIWKWKYCNKQKINMKETG